MLSNAFRNIKNYKSISRFSRGYIKMDDEIPRNSVKDDLTTRDDYLLNRFTRLSNSGHDLTPMTPQEIDSWLNTHPFYNKTQNYSIFLGENQRGTYVMRIGGLPIFTSGSRINSKCSPSYLFFTQPCDSQHIVIDNQDGCIYCSRTNLKIGLELLEDGKIYRVDVNQVLFIPLTDPLPIESQPENIWGTEGQYLAWKRYTISE